VIKSVQKQPGSGLELAVMSSSAFSDISSAATAIAEQQQLSSKTGKRSNPMAAALDDCTLRSTTGTTAT
jgi:hypothetical protein